MDGDHRLFRFIAPVEPDSKQEKVDSSTGPICLGAHRAKKGLAVHALYFGHDAQSLARLSQMPSLYLEHVEGEEDLRRHLTQNPPGLVMIESRPEMESVLGLVELIHRSLGVPTVLVWTPTETLDRSWLKRAFEVGLHDVLYAPVDPEDVRAICRVVGSIRRIAV